MSWYTFTVSDALMRRLPYIISSDKKWDPNLNRYTVLHQQISYFTNSLIRNIWMSLSYNEQVIILADFGRIVNDYVEDDGNEMVFFFLAVQIIPRQKLWRSLTVWYIKMGTGLLIWLLVPGCKLYRVAHWNEDFFNNNSVCCLPYKI